LPPQFLSATLAVLIFTDKNKLPRS